MPVDELRERHIISGEMADLVFQAYDIRGEYPKQYEGDMAYFVGRAAVAFLNGRRVIIGRDARRGGRALLAAIAHGAMDQGADVTDAGLCSTDALQYAAAARGYDFSIMVTASHNDAEDNGTKIVRGNGQSVGRQAGLLDIRDMVVSGRFPKPSRTGSLDRTEVIDDFIRHALSFIDPAKLRPLRIAVDASNGVGGLLVRSLQPHVPFDIVPLFFEPDGRFPNHPPDPTRPECARFLVERVKEGDVDLGIAFDGDADRAVFVDETGEAVNGSELGCLITERVLKKYPGAAIGYCLVSSWVARDVIIENGGRPVVTPVGGANIRPLMVAKNIVFSSERSGHFYMRDNNYGDSGLIAALIVLERLCQTGGTLSELVRPYRRFCMAPEDTVLVGKPESTLQELTTIKEGLIARARELGRGATLVEASGERYEFPDWWFSVRSSGTNPRQLRITMEGRTPEILARQRKEILKHLGVQVEERN